MVCSKIKGGAFCIPCVLFCTNHTSKGKFVNSPFCAWHKKYEKCSNHELAQNHQEAMLLADAI